MGLSSLLRMEARPAIDFIYKENMPNLGDRLSSPKHYYEFVLNPSVGRVAVIGGGALSDLGVAEAQKSKHDSRVSWGIGRTTKSNAAPLDYDSIYRLYDFSSTRDPEWVGEKIDLVPCVSVFHPICDIDPGTKTGVFLSAQQKTSGNIEQFLTDGVVNANNAMDEVSFTHAFSETSRIVTNSYHVTYWGLLSGRSVTVIGYSSKFSSLLKLLGQDPDCIINYKKGDGEELKVAISLALSEPCRNRLPNPAEKKLDIRALNDDFARKLVNAGLFLSIRHPALGRPNRHSRRRP